MEHQSQTRPEPFPEDVVEYFTPNKEKIILQLGIDAVRSCGWYNYDRGYDERA